MNFKESVTPSGVKFSVRHLIGADQDLLTKQLKSGEGSSSAFNEMMTDALQSLGDKTKAEITTKHTRSLLSNDRIFILLTIRQHTLDYKKEFDFKYEFALKQGGKNKEVFDFYVELTHENFPVKPYYWVQERIKELADVAKTNNEEFVMPNGHTVPFPVMYNDYAEMLKENQFFTVDLPKSGFKVRWEVLNGETEQQFGEAMKNDARINLMLDMRKPKQLFKKEGSEQVTPIMYETAKQHIIDLEFLRKDIQDKEGSVDTSLTIQHPNDPTRKDRVNLITLPVFFFPSLGR